MATKEQVSTNSVTWPRSICNTAGAVHRFDVTAVGNKGAFVVEPTGAHRTPILTPGEALRRFRRMYGRTTAAEERHTSVRYGLVTDSYEGLASAGVVGYVPESRRTPAWIVSNCTNAAPPKDDSHAANGTVLFAVADTRAVKSWGWVFLPHSHRFRNPGEAGPATLLDHPKATATPFYSAKWSVAGRHPDGRVLLKYRTKQCYTLDHVNYDGTSSGTYEVSIILSSGPGRACPRQSSSAPYVEILPLEGPIRTLKHEKTGPARFRPE